MQKKKRPDHLVEPLFLQTLKTMRELQLREELFYQLNVKLSDGRILTPLSLFLIIIIFLFY